MSASMDPSSESAMEANQSSPNSHASITVSEPTDSTAFHTESDPSASNLQDSGNPAPSPPDIPLESDPNASESRSVNEESDRTSKDSGQAEDSMPQLPPRPVEPLESDCCGEGCTPCVFDIYNQEVALWEAECRRIQYGGKDEIRPDILSQDVYTQLELKSVERETQDCNIYTFVVPGNGRLNIGLAQHLIIRQNDENRSITRQYTPISHPDSYGQIQFVIKLYPTGQMSQLVQQWTAGSMVEFRGPFGNFTYQPNSYRHILLLAAGTGVAPMLQLIRHVLDNDADDTVLHLVAAFRTYSDVLRKAWLDEWVAYWNFTVTYVLSQDTTDPPTYRYGDNIVHGRLSQQHIARFLDDKQEVKVLICGTRSFDKDMVTYVKALGIAEEHIFKF